MLLDALGVSSAVLVGHDWGSAIAYGAATAYPERLDKVVVVGIPHPITLRPTLSGARDGRHFVYFKLPWAAFTARAFDLKLVDRLYRRWAPHWDGPEREASVVDAVETLRDKRVLRGALAYYKALNPLDRLFRQKISVPGLIVGGSDDPPVFQNGFAATPKRFTASCDVRILEGAGHWPHREQEAAFVAALLECLAR